ncbi:hypothetical protein [Flavobacterium degerlachei]|jgi:hypothetical protein|uniref:Uncharacterized protein n=1 Tax=Flavobacterium degerlachei TaxID=229203 RepID=A0A1H3GPY8_9FLAO|nr:hypothetical protein [Flavobacterium degerlachei]SDY05383.1 hypothetical protein SAMN05444338_1265 [Flavobacterium degerlachei]
MEDLKTIESLILALEESGHLELKISKERLIILINKYLTGQEI